MTKLDYADWIAIALLVVIAGLVRDIAIHRGWHCETVAFYNAYYQGAAICMDYTR